MFTMLYCGSSKNKEKCEYVLKEDGPKEKYMQYKSMSDDMIVENS